MKIIHFGLICIISLTISIILPLEGFTDSKKGSAHYRCYLYDNFNSGTINPNLWDLDQSSATITPEDGRVKIVHDLTLPNDSSWLIFKKKPEKIKEIRVKIWIEQFPTVSYFGDPRVRIAAWQGEDKDGNPVMNQLQVRPEFNTIDFRASAMADELAINILYEIFAGYFKSPIENLYQQFELILGFDRSKLEYEESSLGKISYELKDKLLPTDLVYKGIGTRNNYWYDGEFTLYLDDVHVCY